MNKVFPNDGRPLTRAEIKARIPKPQHDGLKMFGCFVAIIGLLTIACNTPAIFRMF